MILLPVEFLLLYIRFLPIQKMSNAQSFNLASLIFVVVTTSV